MSSPANHLLVRADASPAIGAGHVMRCFALAQQWRVDGGRATFASCALPEAIESRLREQGFDVARIDGEPGSPADAAATLELVGQRDATVVIDGYRFSAAFQDAIYRRVGATLVVDDFGQIGSYRANLILDQNLGATENAYLDRPHGCRLLMGPKYIMLRREFLDAGGREPTVNRTVRSILVTTGGADIGGLAARILEALEQVPGRFEITVVIGGAAPGNETRDPPDANGRHRVRTVVNATDMSTLMGTSDVVISAAGSTAWELAHLGIPAVLGVVADNQEEAAAAVARCGAAVVFDGRPGSAIDDIRRAVSTVIDDHSRRVVMSETARRLVDGHGVRRVVDAIRNTTERGHP
jgi:UDP-2,4-diacetamido-2,4,6-trideoxy-beta-L-altropyranose hydrolase